MHTYPKCIHTNTKHTYTTHTHIEKELTLCNNLSLSSQSLHFLSSHRHHIPKRYDTLHTSSIIHNNQNNRNRNVV